MISIIGSGRVGSAIAFLAASKSLDDIVLVNRTKNKAIGEALDISNCIPEDSSISVNGTDSLSDTKDSDIFVITASAGTYSQSRTELIHDQVEMTKKIIGDLPINSKSLIIMVSNPVDVLTYVCVKESNIEAKKIFGIASSLDTSRFRYLLSKELSTDQSHIHDALVLGEHGDSMVPIFSRAKKNDIPVLELLDANQIASISGNLRFYWKALREYKSRSVFGISKQTCDVIEAITNNSEINVPSSVLVNGEFGISDVCLGVPTTITKKGIEKIHEVSLAEEELEKLHNSANEIKDDLKESY